MAVESSENIVRHCEQIRDHRTMQDRKVESNLSHGLLSLIFLEQNVIIQSISIMHFWHGGIPWKQRWACSLKKIIFNSKGQQIGCCQRNF